MASWELWFLHIFWVIKTISLHSLKVYFIYLGKMYGLWYSSENVFSLLHVCYTIFWFIIWEDMMQRENTWHTFGKMSTSITSNQHYSRHKSACWLNPSRQRWKSDKGWGVRVRPWCWEVAGPWTTAAWFTTPAVPPHRASRWHSDGGSGFPLESSELVPSHCVLPGGTKSALPLS